MTFKAKEKDNFTTKPMFISKTKHIMYNQKTRRKRECNIKHFKANKNMKILLIFKNSSARVTLILKT